MYAWKLRPPCSVHAVTATRERRSADAPRTTPSYEKALAARTKLVVDVGRDYFGSHESWGAFALGRRRDSQRSGAMTVVSCPRRSAALVWVGRIKDDAPSAGRLRALLLGSSCHGHARLRDCFRMWTTISPEKTVAARAKLVVDAVWPSFEHTSVREAGFSIRGLYSRLRGSSPNVSCPRRSAAPLFVAGIQDEIPSAGILRRP